MESLVPIGLLAAASIGVLFSKRKETFQNLESNFVQPASEKYNPLANLIAPMRNPLLPPNFTPTDLQQAQIRSRQALQTNQAYPDNPSFQIRSRSTREYKINPESEGTAFYDVQQCEKVMTADCSAFDNPKFKNCGICFEEGTDSQGSGKVGGLYIDEDDKEAAEYNSKKLGSRFPNYTPSVGSCKANRFVTTKEDCIRMKKKLECEKKQNFDVPGCSQCLQDSTFQYLDESVVKNAPSLFLVGQGSATITHVQTTLQLALSNTPQQVSLPKLQEGDTVQISVNGASSFVAGYLNGATPSGVFTMDISRLIPVDQKSGTKPRMGGSLTIGDQAYMILKPASDSMALILTNPFTFVSGEEAALCPSPYLTKAKSAEFLNSSPCYKKGQAPGNYSQECMQSLYEASGCSSSGKAYPGSKEAAMNLQYKDGQALTLGSIADSLFSMFNKATTGKNESGQPLAIQEWDVNSSKCLGKQITSVCDKYDKSNGPLGADCLSYLWQNAGEKETVPGVSNTYTSPTSIASLAGKNVNTYCRTSGSLAPIDANGKENPTAIQIAQSKGGVDAVKAFYDSISRNANDNSKTDAQREEAIRQCYGISLESYRQTQGGRRVGISSVLDDPSGTTKSVMRPNLDTKCFIFRPTGRRIEDSTPLRGAYSKSILVLNSTATEAMNLFSNMNNIPQGFTVRIGYMKEGNAPDKFRIVVTNQFQNTIKEETIVTIPSGFSALIQVVKTLNEPWVSNASFYSATLTPLDNDPGCSEAFPTQYISIRDRKTGLALDTQGGLLFSQPTQSTTQQWNFNETLQSRSLGKCLTVSNTMSKSPLSMETCSGGMNQKFVETNGYLAPIQAPQLAIVPEGNGLILADMRIVQEKQASTGNPEWGKVNLVRM